MMLLPQQEESIQTLSEELSDGSIQNQHSSTLESLYFTLSSSSTSSSEAESTFKSTQSKSISLPSLTTFLPTRTNSRNSKCSEEKNKQSEMVLYHVRVLYPFKKLACDDLRLEPNEELDVVHCVWDLSL